MLQAITTRYLGPTATKGARVKAIAQAKTVTVVWDNGLNVEQNHDKAALTLAKKMEWNHTYCGGALPNGKDNVYVCVKVNHKGTKPILGSCWS